MKNTFPYIDIEFVLDQDRPFYSNDGWLFRAVVADPFDDTFRIELSYKKYFSEEKFKSEGFLWQFKAKKDFLIIARLSRKNAFKKYQYISTKLSTALKWKYHDCTQKFIRDAISELSSLG